MTVHGCITKDDYRLIGNTLWDTVTWNVTAPT